MVQRERHFEDKTENFICKKGKEFEKMYFEDPNASLEGINKGIWNVSVVSLLRELVQLLEKKDL